MIHELFHVFGLYTDVTLMQGWSYQYSNNVIRAAWNEPISIEGYKEVLRKEGEPSFIDQLRKEGKL